MRKWIQMNDDKFGLIFLTLDNAYIHYSVSLSDPNALTK